MKQSTQFQVKYAIDRLLGAFLTVLLSPIMLVIGAAIAAKDGRPVLFRQDRSGKDEVVFPIVKFRTMIPDADQHLDGAGNPTTNRITRTGVFLRSTSLDELPNVFNIARGDMSFVGPRPPLPSHADTYSNEQKRRFRVRPGITGLAQISGRNQLPWSRRLELDNEYIDNFSLANDLRILWRTASVVLRRSGVELDRNPRIADDIGPR